MLVPKNDSPAFSTDMDGEVDTNEGPPYKGDATACFLGERDLERAAVDSLGTRFPDFASITLSASKGNSGAMPPLL